MPLTPLSSDPHWYKDAIIYQTHVKCFFDSNNDGVGDFPGLIQKLDYLQSLGITAIWVLPFYPSPLRDDGYDIKNYGDVHPSYGTLKDFRQFVREAHERGMRVITELVINHTSDQHPWFQAARRAPADSSKRRFYVWSDTPKRYDGVRIIFTDTETSNWAWDDEAKAYYWHRFFNHQPDLNFDNPQVRRAVERVMRFWLDMGVDGLRLDAVPYLIEREGTNCENLPETHDVLKALRRALDARHEGRMLLAEANQWPADVRPYFGDGDECHMAFHFPLMPRMFMAVRQEDRRPITEILRQTPTIPADCQWALFLRNHDELTLEMVTDEERDYLYNAYAADPQMRLNLGIRRRLAPLLEGNRQRIELLNSLLFSLPGTPVIYYGDEIGMGDNVYLGDRNGVRTPMQWTGDRNAGFSRADPARLYAPPIMDPVYGYQALNVEAQDRSPFSLLAWMRHIISVRKQCPTFGRGQTTFLHPANRKVLVYLRHDEQTTVLVVANLARTVQPVELDLSAYAGLTPVEMLGQTEFPRIGDLPYFLTLSPYGFYWFRLQRAAAPIAVQTLRTPAESVDTLPTVLAGPTWERLLDGNVRALVEESALADFLRRQRWFASKLKTIAGATFSDWALVSTQPGVTFLTTVDVRFTDGASERYFVPLATASGAEADRVLADYPASVVARISGARPGVIYDAIWDDEACRRLWSLFQSQGTLSARRGTFRASPALPGDTPTDVEAVPKITRGAGEQTNTNVVIGDRYMLKIFRRLEPGVNPDVEIGRYLARRPDVRVPRLMGSLDYQEPSGQAATMAMVQRLVASQWGGWEHAVAEVRQYLEGVEIRVRTGEPPPEMPASALDDAIGGKQVPGEDEVGAYVSDLVTLARRTAELHLALASDGEDPAFAPEPIGADEIRLVEARARGVIDLLAAEQAGVDPAVRPDVQWLIDHRAALETKIAVATRVGQAGMKCRTHGDYHLGQVLHAEGDAVILDFEGEPGRSLEERRGKQSPLRDVAGMLRSFEYAGYAALFAFTEARPDDFKVLEPWTQAWAARAAAVFVRTYLERAKGAPFLPAGNEDVKAMLELFLTEKALYELKYELNNRPGWSRIPLRGLRAIVAVDSPPPATTV